MASFRIVMRQLLGNLLLNAMDAMPEGGDLSARICRAHEWLHRDRNGLRMTIADTGTGIAPEILKRVKEPFFTTKGSSGHGMGLAVVQQIVTQHRGVLKIRSCVEPRRSGTVVTVFLPSAAAA